MGTTDYYLILGWSATIGVKNIILLPVVFNDLVWGVIKNEIISK